MKQSNSIRKKLFLYLSGFVLFIVSILFLVQVVFLDGFYRAIKMNEIKTISGHISAAMKSELSEDGGTAKDGDESGLDEDIVNYLDSLSFSGDFSVAIISGSGEVDYISSGFKDSSINLTSKAGLLDMYAKVSRKESKEHTFVIKEYFSALSIAPRDRRISAMVNQQYESLLFVKIYEDIQKMVAIEFIITPMHATQSVLRVQLFYVTGLLILSAAILAYILSKKIAQPIVDINASAKDLIGGEYSLSLPRDTYVEVSELNDTMHSVSVELKKADIMQKELIANVSHDLRTPLTMIIGYAEAMRDLPQEYNSENTQVIIDEAKRLNRLVNDILELSKAGAGAADLKLSRVNLTELVGEIKDRCSVLTGSEGYIYEWEYDEEIYVYADADKISQVIYNLIGNAITYTGDDKRVRIIQERISNQGEEYARISVEDSGAGISKDSLEDIWDRYYKLDKTHVRSTIGTGLGLSIVKSIVLSHKGRYGVESNVGSGSCFWVELPISYTPECK